MSLFELINTIDFTKAVNSKNPVPMELVGQVCKNFVGPCTSHLFSLLIRLALDMNCHLVL